jgi:hypothetical protein
MKQTKRRQLRATIADRLEYHTGVRIYRDGWHIEQCENDMQRAGYMDALRAEADAETERYLAAHPQAVAA